MKKTVRWGAAAALAAVALAYGGDAAAGGLYYAERGVRPLGRGGAFVAGADDPGAIYYNPAGLAFAGEQLLLDASWLNFRSTYQRRALVRQADPATGQPTGVEFVQTFEEVEGTTPVLPIPTAAYSNPFGLEDFNFAIGFWAPYSTLMSYPEEVRGNPAPQRYSLITLDGSALVIGGLYASWQPTEEIALGAGVEVLTGFFEATVAFSACPPERLICAPEQPDYDAVTRLRVGPIFAPSGILGAIVQPVDDIRIGTSFHLPYHVDSPATVDVRMPSAPAFQTAEQRGKDGNVTFDLPWTFRAGIEYRGIENTRVEVAYTYENWSTHDSIDLDPQNIRLANVVGFSEETSVAPVSLERNFQDTWSARVGGEHTLELEGYDFDLRAGAMYETSAIPKEYLSATTVDLDKITLAIGLGIHIGRWRFDGLIAKVFATGQDVDVREAEIERVYPIRSNPPEINDPINAGSYDASANIFGVGLAYQFDDDPAPAPPGKRQPAPAPTPRPAPVGKSGG